MPSFDDAIEQAADRPAFSNGTEGEAWMANWCHRCIKDADDLCPLVSVSFLGKTPAQWQEKDLGSLGNQYECSEFEAAP